MLIILTKRVRNLKWFKRMNTGWVKEARTGNTLKQAIPYAGFVGYFINGIGNYGFRYALEIDKALEKTAHCTETKISTVNA